MHVCLFLKAIKLFFICFVIFQIFSTQANIPGVLKYELLLNYYFGQLPVLRMLYIKANLALYILY